MTSDEFVDLTAWMLPRWSEMAAWTDEQVGALYDDLRPWPAADVVDVVEVLWQQGREFAPKGGPITMILRERGVVRIGPALDQKIPEPTVPWTDVADRLGCPGTSLADYALRKETE